MFKTIYLFLFLLVTGVLNAQPEPGSGHPAYLSIQSFSRQADVLGALNDQAALAGFKNFSTSIYSEQRYLIPQLRSFAASTVLPLQSGSFGLIASWFGFALHNESLLGLAYARKMGNTDIGARFNYFTMASKGYEQSREFDFETGIRYHFTSRLQGGFHLANPLHFPRQQGVTSLPLCFSMGLGWDASDNFYAGCLLVKTGERPPDFRTGFQYVFAKKLFARAGLCTALTEFYLGAGILLGRLRIDLTTSIHPQLGASPGLMLSYVAGDRP